MRFAVAALGLALLALTWNAVGAWGEAIGSAEVSIASDGVVEVKLEASVTPGLNEIPLPVEPVPTTILVEIDGTIIPPLYVEGVLYVPSEGEGVAKVSYIAKVEVTDGIVSFNVNPSGEVTLIVDPQVILLSLPEGITGYDIGSNGSLVIRFTGPSVIKFTLSQAVTTPPPPTGEVTTTEATQQQTTMTETATPGSEGEGEETKTPPPSPTPQPATTPTTQGEDGNRGLLVIAALGALSLLVAGGAVYLLLRSRGGRGGGEVETAILEPGELDQTDREIIEALKKAGGEVLQSELQRMLNMPKSTLWRRLRRLREMGYIDIVREGKTNRVKLLREPGD